MQELDEKKKITTTTYDSLIRDKTSSSKIVQRQHSYDTQKEEVDIHGEYWSLSIFDFSDYAGSILIEGNFIPLHGKIIFFLPPFSLLYWLIHPGTIQWNYLISMNCSFDFKSELSLPIMFDSKDFDLNSSDFEKYSELELIKKIKVNSNRGIKITNQVRSVSFHAKKLIDTSFRQKKELKDLFSKSGGSYEYISRQYKKDFRISPVQYRNQLRMIQASVDFLFNNKLSVESVYNDLGIEDSSYFYQSFKKHLLAEPSRFKILK